MTSINAHGPFPQPRAARRQHSASAPAAQNLSLALVGQASPERSAVEIGIMQKFERTYGAHLTHFLPDLLRLSVSDNLGAVVGIRAADGNSLFLEQYLDQPVEQAVASAFMTPVDRNQIVEIGNLAANLPGLACSLFAILAEVLSQAGYRWVACTATPQVESMLAKMNFPARTICSADPSRLEADSADWGDYYASQPRVIAGDVQLAAAQVASNREVAALIRHYRRPIPQMAASLRRTS